MVQGGPDQPRLRRRPRRDERDGQGDDGHRRGDRREAAPCWPPRTPSPTRCSTKSRMKGAKGLLISITGGLDMTLLRSRRGGQPHPRGGRPGSQHHLRRHLRRRARRHDPRLGGRHRHGPAKSAATPPRDGAPHRRGDRAPAQRGAPAPGARWPITATPPRPVSRPRSRRRSPRPSRPTSSRSFQPPVYQPAAVGPRAARGPPGRQYPPGAAQARLCRAHAGAPRPSPSR